MSVIILKQVLRLVLLVGLVFPGAALRAQAGGEEVAVTGRELLADCEPGGLSTQPTRECMQYVFGLVQTVLMLQQMEPGERLFCIDPERSSLAEVTGTVTRWLKEVPARLDEEAYVLVSEALNASYPCDSMEAI